jgi:hypothetical protein
MMNLENTHSFDIRDLKPEDKIWVQRVLVQYWGSTVQVTRGNKFQADTLPGVVAVRDGSEVGLLTYNIVDSECEIVTHNSMAGHGGIGSCLLDAIRDTNDNTPAMRFYQRRGFDMIALYRNAVNEARKLKSEIPNVGFDGITIRHEIEMEYML